MEDNLESKIKTYNERSFQHAQNWKKIHALANYAHSLDKFSDWEPLEFMIRYFSRGYLDEAQETFLDSLLARYGVDYDKWCYKDHPWVKRQFLKKREIESGQLEFPFHELDQAEMEARSKMPLFSKIVAFKLYGSEAM